MRWNKQALKRWIWWSNPKDSPQKIAFIRTLQVHAFLLLLLSLGHFSFANTAPRQRLKTKTIHLEAKKVAAVKKQSVAKPTTQAKKQPTSSVQPKKGPSSLERLSRLDESLKKLEESFKKAPKNLVIEAKSAIENFPAAQYETQLIQILQSSLKLIDPDPVDVTIAVQPNGIIATMHSTASTSSLNLKIVEETLRKMVFPPFDGDQPMEFTLHLCTNNP